MIAATGDGVGGEVKSDGGEVKSDGGEVRGDGGEVNGVEGEETEEIVGLYRVSVI